MRQPQDWNLENQQGSRHLRVVHVVGDAPWRIVHCMGLADHSHDVVQIFEVLGEDVSRLGEPGVV